VLPINSRVDGELRELRVRFGKTGHRVLYRRSGLLVVLLHIFEKNTDKLPARDRELAIRRFTPD
jgi:phage-related protein